MKILKRYVVTCGAVSLLLILLLFIFRDFGKIQESENSFSMTDGWKVTINDTVYEDVDVSKFQFAHAQRGDVIKMEQLLPNQASENVILRFYAIHAQIEVWVGETLIYEYGTKDYENGRMLGYGYHFIDLPRNSAGEKMEIILRASEQNAFSYLEAPVLEEGTRMIRNFFIERRMAIAIILFLIVFGMVFTMGTIFFSFQGKDFYRLICIALFSFMAGIWSFCNYDIILLFTYNLRMKALLEFAALYVAPIFFFGYFYEDAMTDSGKMAKRAYWAIFGAQILFSVMTFVLQISNLVHFPRMLPVALLLLCMMVLYLVALFFTKIRKHRRNSNVLLGGMSILVLFVACEVIRFYLTKYGKSAETGHFINYMYLGVFAFILALIVDFGRKIAASVYSKATNEALEKMAYTDALTGLSNRRKCEELYDEIDKEKSDYAVMALDLNDLKKVNDHLGHEAGDFYIREFGNVLLEVFSDCAEVIRTGGDEFLVVFKEVSKVDIQQKITQMQEKIIQINQCHANWNMSTAYGICCASEDRERTVREADKVADERMYQKKFEMKGKKRR